MQLFICVPHIYVFIRIYVFPQTKHIFMWNIIRWSLTGLKIASRLTLQPKSLIHLPTHDSLIEVLILTLDAEFKATPFVRQCILFP